MFTKEIQLTQSLISLFIEYQVPSDFLLFEEELSSTGPCGSAMDKVVKGHVKSAMDVIEGAKQEQLNATIQTSDVRVKLHKTELSRHRSGMRRECDRYRKVGVTATAKAP